MGSMEPSFWMKRKPWVEAASSTCCATSGDGLDMLMMGMLALLALLALLVSEFSMMI